MLQYIAINMILAISEDTFPMIHQNEVMFVYMHDYNVYYGQRRK